jgi:hypothetical protein
MYGRKPLFPVDAMLESEEHYREQEEYTAEIIRKIKIATDFIKDKANQIKDKRDENNSNLKRIQSFHVGEYVMLYVPRTKRGISNKLCHKWKGPYSIVAQTSPVNYIIKNVENKKTDHVHVSRLKPCYRRENNADGVTFQSEMKFDTPAENPKPKRKSNRNTNNTSTTATEAAGTDYEVEKIVGKGWDEVSPDTWIPKYKVRWKGFTAADDTWEPLDNLVGAEKLIEIYDTLHAEDEETYTDAESNMIAVLLF